MTSAPWGNDAFLKEHPKFQAPMHMIAHGILLMVEAVHHLEPLKPATGTHSGLLGSVAVGTRMFRNCRAGDFPSRGSLTFRCMHGTF